MINYGNGVTGIIKHDESVGYYLYIYNAHNQCIADYLQDTLEHAKEQAEEEYRLMTDQWTLIPKL